jgi:hypothetical protein
VIGQILYLEAEAAGVRATGIVRTETMQAFTDSGFDGIVRG